MALYLRQHAREVGLYMKRLLFLLCVLLLSITFFAPSSAMPTYQQTAGPDTDRDGDGFTQAEEDAIFAVPGRDGVRCGNDAWPADVMSAYGQVPDTQNRVTIHDVMSFLTPVRHLQTSPGQAGYDRRWDIRPGPEGQVDWINLHDLIATYAGDFTDIGSPIMLSSIDRNVFNGPFCSASIPFFKKADSGFDSFAGDPARWAGISNARYRGMLMYPSTSDTKHAWYKGQGPNEGFFYQNAGGIEVGGSQAFGVSGAQALKDAQGNLCYLPFPSGGPFTRYAADVGDPSYRNLLTNYLVSKTNLYPQYIGPYLDDVNLRLNVSCGDRYPADNNSSPVDPRTGQLMTQSSWESYWIGFLQQIRNSLPPGAKIVHNAPWFFLPVGDPEHQAQVQAADYVEMEFGFNEINGVGGQFGWNAKMAYVDWVHSLGRHVIDQEFQNFDPFTNAEITYGLANYFLFTDGQDYFSTFDQSDPDDDWTRYGSTLGQPLGPRYQFEGLWRRDFEYGYVTVDPAIKSGLIVRD